MNNWRTDQLRIDIITLLVVAGMFAFHFWRSQ